jgi:hypothetical protein
MSEDRERFEDSDRIERLEDDADDFEGHSLGGEVGRFEDLSPDRLLDRNEESVDVGRNEE